MSVGTSSVDRSVLVVSEASMVDTRDCYTCGKKEHLSWSCHLSRNAGRGRTGRGRGRGTQRGGRGWRGGRGRAGGREAVNLAVIEVTAYRSIW